MGSIIRAFFLVSALTAVSESAFAGSSEDPAIGVIRRQLEKQAKALAEQNSQIALQRHLIESLEKRLQDGDKGGAVTADSQKQPVKSSQLTQASPPPSPRAVASEASQQLSAPTAAVAAIDASQTVPGPRHVGEAPEESNRPPEIQTIASVGGVLTRRGSFVIEPYAEYVHTSLNQFTFQGVQIVDALLIGVINAGRTEQDLGLAGVGVRYSLTDRLEAEVRIPYIYRAQTLTGTLLNSSNSVLAQTAHGSGLGDIEGALHYQINAGGSGVPFFIGNIRYKSDSGSGPWDISYNANGSAKTLPTGSGFGAINPSLTVIYPSEPAVLYANLGWIHNFGNDRGLTVNQTVISQILPGDTYSGSAGIGISLNEDVSFSVGYEQDYILATREIVNGSAQLAQSLLAGELAFGVTMRTFDQNTVNVGLNVGVTRDAPDISLTLRTPISFRAPFL